MTEGYIKTELGEILITHVQSFKSSEEFLKAHPELTAKIWEDCNPKPKVKKPAVEEEK